MPRDRVVIVGAGVAGLVSAFALAARGLDVTVLERRDAPGGKMRQIAIGPARIDSGPTVFTMRWVFDELFAAAGRNFARPIASMQSQIRSAATPYVTRESRWCSAPCVSGAT